MASTTTEWILKLVDKITGPMKAATEAAQTMTEKVDETTEAVEQLGRESEEQSSRLEKFGKGMFFMNEIKDGVDQVADAFMGAIQPGIDFEYAMAQVQAISGISGEQLDTVSDKARKLAKDFGVDAANGAGVFTNILSQLGPEMAKFPDVLNSMGQNAFTLSKTMDGDVNGAISALTASFNSFTPPVNDAIESARVMQEQMNIIAKSAQVGAAEVPDLVMSLKNIGPSAKNAGVSFAETNALLQVLGQNQVKAAEAGTALRNVMLILSAPSSDAAKALKEAGVDIEKMGDKSIPLAERLETLLPVMNDTALMSKLFGRENIVAGQILTGNIDKIKDWTQEVQGSNSATEQAAIIMDTTAEKLKRTQAWVDDLKISFFNLVEPLAPFMKMLGMVTSGIVTLGMTIFSIGQISSLAWGAAWTKMATIVKVAAAGIRTAIASIPIIGWIAIIISALIGLGVYFYNTSATVRGFFWGVGEVIKRFVVGAIKLFGALFEFVVMVLNPSNWFKPGKIQGAFSNLVNYAKDIGKSIGSGYQEGMQAGIEDYKKSHPEKEKKGEEGSPLNISAETLNSPLKIAPNGGNTNNTNNNSGTKGTGGSVGLGGSGGSGSVRNITMNVTMNNSFSISGESDYRKISGRLKQELIAILTDVNPAIS